MSSDATSINNYYVTEITVMIVNTRQLNEKAVVFYRSTVAYPLRKLIQASLLMTICCR